jgi:hypothetical protein
MGVGGGAVAAGEGLPGAAADAAVAGAVVADAAAGADAESGVAGVADAASTTEAEAARANAVEASGWLAGSPSDTHYYCCRTEGDKQKWGGRSRTVPHGAVVALAVVAIEVGFLRVAAGNWTRSSSRSEEVEVDGGDHSSSALGRPRLLLLLLPLPLLPRGGNCHYRSSGHIDYLLDHSFRRHCYFRGR